MYCCFYIVRENNSRVYVSMYDEINHTRLHYNLQVAWDPSSFNFYKASPAEFMLSYTPSFRYERESAATFTAASAAGKAGALGDGVDLAGRAATALRGAGGVRAAGSTGSDYFSSVGCKEASTASPPQDAVLVNIRPVGPVSLLLTPG